MAAFAASTALFSPLATPIPIRAEPAWLIIVLTSAKSTLIKPLIVIKSDIPCTACRKTSSAILKASIIEVFFSTICNNR